MYANYLAEISGRLGIVPQFTPDDTISRTYGIYRLYIGAKPEGTYWRDWGGTYDNPTASLIEIRIVNWLFPVASLADLLAVENSCYFADGYAYVHVTDFTWLYNPSETAMAGLSKYLYGPKNAIDPRDMFLGGSYAEARLLLPSVSVKLSDVIAGITLFGTFGISLANNDGFFDGETSVELFNSPVMVKKSTVENPEYEDFQTIRQGIVESVKTDSAKIDITAADKFRTLDNQICGLINADDYPVAADRQDAVGKPLPVAFGSVTMPLIEIAYTETESGDNVTVDAKYLAAEKITSFEGLYDENGTSLPWSLEGIVIVFSRTSSKDEKLKPKYAKFTGYTENGLGSVVTFLVARDTALQYVPSVWDVTETNRYIANQPRLNMAVTGGDIRGAVKLALQSDTAYLIQKNDGRLTIRKWGEYYAMREIPSWRITGQPEKSFADAQKNYFSSCVVSGKYNDYAKNYGESCVYTEGENAANEKYLKLKRNEYDTRLAETAAMKSLAADLAERFGDMKDTVRVTVGVDNASFNLLDMVRMAVTVNGRKYSGNEEWVIKEIDYVRDTLALEELESDYFKPHTFLVDSDAALAAWVNNDEGNDYTAVLVARGTFTSRKTLNLTACGTKSVVGMRGSLLSFPTYTGYGLGYESVPEGTDYFMDGVNVSGGGFLFFNCANLRNCTGSGYYLNCTGYVFEDCVNLINCTAAFGGDGSARCFSGCTNLTDCAGTGIGHADGREGFGEIYGSGCGHIFTECENLTGCTATGDSGGISLAFCRCTNLENCTGTAYSSDYGLIHYARRCEAFGFYLCENLTGCTGTGIARGEIANSGYGFYKCVNFTDCTGSGTGTGGAPGYGFFECVGGADA
jgi:uncharacterized protein YkvS